MKVYLDSDAASIRDLAVEVCKEEKVEIILVKNYSQDFSTNYGTIINVDVESDAADLYIVNHLEKGDLVLTNDKGLSSLALARLAYVMDFGGNTINNLNIDSYLASRHMSRLMREQGIYTHFKKRKKSENINFESSLREFLRRNKKMLKLLVSSYCPDCPPALKYVEDNKINVEIIDITSSMKNLKYYLSFRYNNPYFDKIKKDGKVGIPLFIEDEGNKFYTLEEFKEK